MTKYIKPLNHIDIGLSALCHNAKPGQTLTSAEIAQVCQCSSATINDIYQSGLKKLRRRVHLSEHLGA